MCGIVGIININKSARPLQESAIDDLHIAMDVQKHRGPDDQGVCSFSFDNLKSHSVEDAHDVNPGLPLDGMIGFNRLSIKDLTMAGHQPMTTVDGKVIRLSNIFSVKRTKV